MASLIFLRSYRVGFTSFFSREHETSRRFLCGFLEQRKFKCSGWTDEGNSASPQRAESKNRGSKPRKKDLKCKDVNRTRWGLELAWVTKALEPALQLCKRALPSEGWETRKNSECPPRDRSFSEILTSIQRSKVIVKDWSLSDLTIGLYLIYLRQSSANPSSEEVKGALISSERIVNDLIYFCELARATYKENPSGVARNSMIRESNIVKFMNDSNVMRPGYYVGIDECRKLVVLGIRGTHTIYDVITSIVTCGHEEVARDGYSAHFGTSEAARWFLNHEIGTIRKCLDDHPGFRVRIVGHSLGGAAASLVAIMMRRKSRMELGFSPDIVSAVGYATPPCVSKEVAEECSHYVTTVVMRDDIVPSLGVASLTRLRNEILQTDWKGVLEKEDWKNVVGLVTNALQAVSAFQAVTRKLADRTQFWRRSEDVGAGSPPTSPPGEGAPSSLEELFVPGRVYCIRRNNDKSDDDNGETPRRRHEETFTLWMRDPREHAPNVIVLSNNSFSDHKCDNHYYALRDVLKALI